MRIPVESRLTIRDIDPHTRMVVREHTGPNVVTSIGIESFVALLGGGFGFPTVGANAYEPRTICRAAAGGCFVGEMRLGQSLAVGIPQPSDTGLKGATAFTGSSPASMSVSYPGTGEVAFRVRLPATEFGGEEFTEEGLFTRDGDLVARRIIDPPWSKPVGLETEFVHTLRFARTARALDLVATIDVDAAVDGALLGDYLLGSVADVIAVIDGSLDVSGPPVPANLLINPSFDLLPAYTGWSVVSSTWTSLSGAGGIYPAPISTYAAICGGSFPTASGEIRQDVNIAPWASSIDAGNAALTYQGYGTCSNEGTPDQVRHITEVYDAGMGLLASYDTGQFGTPFVWSVRTHAFSPLPVGSRIVRLRVIHYRNAGTNMNSLSDELSLSLAIGP